MLAIADILPVMTAYIDRGFVYRFVNKPFAEWFDRPRRNARAAMREIIGAETFAGRRADAGAALAGSGSSSPPSSSIRAAGRWRCRSNMCRGRIRAGEVRGIIVVATDVTEQRVDQRALRESEERFRRIANSAPVMMWVTRLDRRRDFVNEAYAEFACGPGCDHEEARLLDWRTRIHPEDASGSSLRASPARRAGAFTLEARYKRHDGE